MDINSNSTMKLLIFINFGIFIPENYSLLTLEKRQAHGFFLTKVAKQTKTDAKKKENNKGKTSLFFCQGFLSSPFRYGFFG